MLSVARNFAEAPEESSGALPGGMPDVADVQVVRDYRLIEADWRAFEAVAVGHVFQTYDFVAPWLAHVGAARSVSPRIVVGRGADGAIRFLLPLGVRVCFGTRMLEWLGGEHADYHCGLYAPRYLAGFVASAERAGALPRSIAGLFKEEIDVIHFQRQPSAIAGVPNPFARFHPIPFSAKSHLTRLTGNWDDYYRSKRNSSSRRHDRSKWLRMEAAGPVRLIDATTPEDVRRVLRALFAQKDQSLAARGAPSFFEEASVREFYEALALRPHPDGLSHVSALEVNGDIVATNWGLIRGNHYYYVMTSYAAGPIAASSPGRALMYHLMRWCIERCIDVFDFTIGDEEFKAQWCEESSTLFDSVAVVNPRGHGLAATLRTTKTVKRAIKGNPRLMSLAYQIRRRFPVLG